MSGKIVFIGAGNMAEALVRGLIQRGGVKPSRIQVTDTRAGQLEHFARAYGALTSADNAGAVRDAEAVILAVKPQSMGEVLQQLNGRVPATCVVISIAAGIPCAALERGLGGSPRVVRSMPNTPALVGKGITAICAGAHASEPDLAMAEQLLRAVGHVVRVAERDMDAVTALSGSGPAYVFYLMESMLMAADEIGVDRAIARRLVCETIAGAAELAAQSTETPAELRARVTSKGGTTAAAIGVLDGQAVQKTFRDAILAARKRAGELSAS